MPETPKPNPVFDEMKPGGPMLGGIHPMPRTVSLNGAELPVIAAIYVPARGSHVASHIVVYRTGETTHNVHHLVYSDTTWLHQGDYDLSLSDAMDELIRRATLEGIIATPDTDEAPRCPDDDNTGIPTNVLGIYECPLCKKDLPA